MMTMTRKNSFLGKRSRVRHWRKMRQSQELPQLMWKMIILYQYILLHEFFYQYLLF
jgi:hypothetical protein